MSELSGSGESWADVGDRIRQAREYLGFAQADVAEALGVSRPTISALESGKRKVSSLELKKLAQVLRRPVEYFLGAPTGEADDTIGAIYRAARELSDQDREQVRRFAEFLRSAGNPPEPADD